MGRKRNDREETAEPRFTAERNILELLEEEPRAKDVLLEFGLPCHRCIVAEGETLAEGCAPLGLRVDEVLDRLNGLDAEKGDR